MKFPTLTEKIVTVKEDQSKHDNAMQRACHLGACQALPHNG